MSAKCHSAELSLEEEEEEDEREEVDEDRLFPLNKGAGCVLYLAGAYGSGASGVVKVVLCVTTVTQFP